MLLLCWGSYRWAHNLWVLIIYLFFLLVIFPSEIPRLTTDPLEKVCSGIWKLLSFLRLPSRDGSPSLPLLSLFLSFIFFPTSFWRQWAAFWVPDVLCQHSEVVLWNLLSVQMFFWWICWGESGLPALFHCHLKTAPASAYFIVQLSHLYMNTGKTVALTRWTFVDKVMSMLFNMLSRLVIAFLPRSKNL